MDRIMAIAAKHNLAVVEDAAQALLAKFDGKKAGSFGIAGCFSFYPFKSLGGFGDGGALTTNDPEVARMATLLRYNGEDRETGEFFITARPHCSITCMPPCLTRSCAICPNGWSIAAKIAAQLSQGAGRDRANSPAPLQSGPAERLFQNYVVRTGCRDALRAFGAQGVETLVAMAQADVGIPGTGPKQAGRARKRSHLRGGHLAADECRDHARARRVSPSRQFANSSARERHYRLGV